MERCPTCHEDASRVSHRCHDCGKRCHAFCGENVTEGYASFLRCTPCALALSSARLDGLDGGGDASDALQSPAQGKRKRGIQNVSSIAQRRKVVKWMAAQDAAGLIHFQTAAVQQFPDIFKGDNLHAHIQKASQWWRARAAILEAVDDAEAAGQPPVARLSAKALTGRGRKRSAWVQWLYPKLYTEASRLQQAGVRTTIAVLRSTTQRILESSTDMYNHAFVDPADGRQIGQKITSRWIQAFCKAHPDINNHSRAVKARATFDGDSDAHSADDADEDEDQPAPPPVRPRVASSAPNYGRSNDVAPGTVQALVGLGEKLLELERGRVELMHKQFEFEMESRREEMALRREIEQQRQREFELTYQAQQAKYELDRMALEAKLQKAGVSIQRRE